jgi:hypothetical protein
MKTAKAQRRRERILSVVRSASLRLCGLISLLIATAASATEPAISDVIPPGGQRGTQLELTISGKRLDDAAELLFYEPGLSVDKLEPAKDKLTAQLQIAPDCPLGEHAFRVRTKTGLSDLRTFWVGTLPNVQEKEPNNDLDKPQKIDLNVTVNGVITGEDVDCFAVDAQQGQRLTAVVEGLRLGRAMWDPRVAIFDSKHALMALSDDHPLVRQDCIASILAPADGQYIIQLRDTMYGGSDKCRYRLHVGTFPQPTAVLPLGGKPGEEIDFRFLGDLKGEFNRKIRLPDHSDPEHWLFAEDSDGTSAAGIPIRINDLPNFVELAADDSSHSELSKAIPVEAPGAINGVISQPNQFDFYKFTSKKGEVWDINCFARRLRSPLDSLVQVYQLDGKLLAGNDDTGGPDSYIRFTAPADGEFAVSIRDHLMHGGPTYTYRIEITRVAPSMVVNLPRVQQYTQDRQTIVVPRGGRYAARVGIERKEFGGDVAISASDLPPGVTAEDSLVTGPVTSAPMFFQAAADAPLGGVLATLTGKTTDPKQELHGDFRQTTDLVYGDNQTLFWKYDAQRLAVVVTDEAPFSLEVVEPKVPLVQNGSMQLKVRAERKDDFKAPITLELIHSAPGVSNASNVTIPEGQTEALFPLNANDKPGMGKWKLAVMGKATVNGGAVWVSSQLATLEVAPAHVQFAIDRTAAQRGQTAEVVCKIRHITPFQGTAKAHLFGLPNKVTADEIEFNNETAELTFPVKIDTESPLGRQKGIGCQVVVTQNEEPIVQNVGSTELRIDPAPPPKPEAKSDAAAAVANPKPPEKRLTRLEKLRQEATEKQQEK